MVEVSVLVEPCPLDVEALERIVGAALAHRDAGDLRLGVVMAPDSLMVELHGAYLDDPTPTDVITFDLRDESLASDPDALDGELYIGIEEARRVAERRGVTFERELALYVVHGVLHLCGLDDLTDADAAEMRVAERAVMEALGYPPDTLPHHG